jgi:hypothetical protein
MAAAVVTTASSIAEQQQQQSGPKTFALELGVSGLSEADIAAEFIAQGMVRVVLPQTSEEAIAFAKGLQAPIDWVVNHNGKYVPGWNGICCNIKSFLHHAMSCLTAKNELTLNMQKIGADAWLAPTWTLEAMEALVYSNPAAVPAPPLIMKPVGTGAFSGRDILIVQKPEQVRNALRDCRKTLQRRPKYTTYVVSRLVRPVVTVHEGRKFHLRVYFLITASNGTRVPFQVRWLPIAKLLMASNTYEHGSMDRSVQDTHMDSTGGNLYIHLDPSSPYAKMVPSHNAMLPFDAERWERLRTELDELCQHFATIGKAHAAKYAESSEAYEVYGADILFDADHAQQRAVLLELNSRVGYAPFADKPCAEHSQFSRYFARYLLDALGV